MGTIVGHAFTHIESHAARGIAVIELPIPTRIRLLRPSDRKLFAGAAIGALVVVFAGFSRTYFLKFLYHTPALPWLVHLHGAVMTSWFVLFFAQTSLISRHRADYTAGSGRSVQRSSW